MSKENKEREKRIEEMAEVIERVLTHLVFRQVQQEWETLYGGNYWGFRLPDGEEQG